MDEKNHLKELSDSLKAVHTTLDSMNTNIVIVQTETRGINSRLDRANGTLLTHEEKIACLEKGAVSWDLVKKIVFAMCGIILVGATSALITLIYR